MLSVGQLHQDTNLHSFLPLIGGKSTQQTPSEGLQKPLDDINNSILVGINRLSIMNDPITMHRQANEENINSYRCNPVQGGDYERLLPRHSITILTQLHYE